MSFVEFTGTARLDKRTKRLVRRLGPDDIAIIDHRDLDRVSAEELLATNVRVVINCAPSMSGRFPNAGPLELVLLERPPGDEARPVAEEAGAADRQLLAVGELVEEVRPHDVDQADAAAHELERPRVRVAAALRGRDVDDHADAGLDELLGRDAVEIGVVDDRDVVRREALDEVLRAPVEPRGPRELDKRAHRTFAVPPKVLEPQGEASIRAFTSDSRSRESPGTPGRRACARSPPGARPRRAARSSCASGRRGPSPRGSAGRRGSRSGAGA